MGMHEADVTKAAEAAFAKLSEKPTCRQYGDFDTLCRATTSMISFDGYSHINVLPLKLFTAHRENLATLLDSNADLLARLAY